MDKTSVMIDGSVVEEDFLGELQPTVQHVHHEYELHLKLDRDGYLFFPGLIDTREIQAARESLALLEKQNHFLEHRIRLLRSGAVDADMLAETARANVGMYSENDVIISIDLSKLKF